MKLNKSEVISTISKHVEELHELTCQYSDINNVCIILERITKLEILLERLNTIEEEEIDLTRLV